MSSFSGSSYDQSARFAGVSRSCTHSLFSYTVSTCWLLTVQPLEASVTGARSQGNSNTTPIRLMSHSQGQKHRSFC